MCPACGPDLLRQHDQGLVHEIGIQHYSKKYMNKHLYAMLSLVIAFCGVLLVAVPRLFLPPPVPIGIVTQNIQRLIFFSF